MEIVVCFGNKILLIMPVREIDGKGFLSASFVISFRKLCRAENVRLHSCDQVSLSSLFSLPHVTLGFKWTFLILSLFNWLERSSRALAMETSEGPQCVILLFQLQFDKSLASQVKTNGVESKEELASDGQEGLEGNVNWQRLWTVSPCNCFKERRLVSLVFLGYCEIWSAWYLLSCTLAAILVGLHWVVRYICRRENSNTMV
ncbi:uncharacterized protein LOC104431876 [Eucalyptus grandis]|uniref:uncharacterized protein LOC104431876 n=1 Tax=Eucalyptus grandis TaxID=71139 RepID=UPI00192EF420|nr:uncharacterized protein LOC104431876 [Eucalyptus grandis]